MQWVFPADCLLQWFAVDLLFRNYLPFMQTLQGSILCVWLQDDVKNLALFVLCSRELVRVLEAITHDLS